MAINPVLYNPICFRAENSSNQNAENQYDKNPVSTKGERAKLFATTAIAGLGVGLRSLWYLYDDGFLVEDVYKTGSKIVDKNKKNLTGSKKELAKLGAFGALTAGFVALIAAVYTAYKTPDVMYNGKVNAFVKGKDMDIYTRSNSIEKSLYDEMNEKAKAATTKEEKEKLNQQYLKLRAAKNQVPDSIKK